jgi:hypothetical protein
MSLPAALEPFRADGLHAAMFIVPAIAAVLAVVLFAASRTVRNDVARLNAWMSKAAKSPQTTVALDPTPTGAATR